MISFPLLNTWYRKPRVILVSFTWFMYWICMRCSNKRVPVSLRPFKFWSWRHNAPWAQQLLQRHVKSDTRFVLFTLVLIACHSSEIKIHHGTLSLRGLWYHTYFIVVVLINEIYSFIIARFCAPWNILILLFAFKTYSSFIVTHPNLLRLITCLDK